jgi:hypothetical protein
MGSGGAAEKRASHENGKLFIYFLHTLGWTYRDIESNTNCTVRENIFLYSSFVYIYNVT